MTRLPQDVVNQFRQAFDTLDTDHSGSISDEEISKLMRITGQKPTKEAINAIIKEMDSDGNGTIEFDEFMKVVEANVTDVISLSEIREVFEVFDKDGDGKFGIKELREVMKTLGQNLDDAELQAMIDEIDTNNDGVIDFNEFYEIMSNAQ